MIIVITVHRCRYGPCRVVLGLFEFSCYTVRSLSFWWRFAWRSGREELKVILNFEVVALVAPLPVVIQLHFYSGVTCYPAGKPKAFHFEWSSCSTYASVCSSISACCFNAFTWEIWVTPWDGKPLLCCYYIKKRQRKWILTKTIGKQILTPAKDSSNKKKNDSEKLRINTKRDKMKGKVNESSPIHQIQ